jgi:hypothetical protein
LEVWRILPSYPPTQPFEASRKYSAYKGAVPRAMRVQAEPPFVVLRTMPPLVVA